METKTRNLRITPQGAFIEECTRVPIAIGDLLKDYAATRPFVIPFFASDTWLVHHASGEKSLVRRMTSLNFNSRTFVTVKTTDLATEVKLYPVCAFAKERLESSDPTIKNLKMELPPDAALYHMIHLSTENKYNHASLALVNTVTGRTHKVPVPNWYDDCALCNGTAVDNKLKSWIPSKGLLALYDIFTQEFDTSEWNCDLVEDRDKMARFHKYDPITGIAEPWPENWAEVLGHCGPGALVTAVLEAILPTGGQNA